MKNFLDKIKLGRQATLFDSYLYVLKGFLSILTGYILFHNHSIIGKDMISLLFGMMLTLEPINIIGIKSGLDQIKASILGGVVTAILVSLFGVNALTIPLGVAATMYISLKFNWRFVSPVAIFTAIYMTQYIQLDAMGMPSMLITLRLRLLALGSGIAIAIFYNYLFSKFFYSNMLRKRLVYIVESLRTYLNSYISHEDDGEMTSLKKDITGLFGDIDLVISQIGDFNKIDTEKIPYDHYRCALQELRDFTHYTLDVIMYRMRHDKGVADLTILEMLVALLSEIQTVVETKKSDTTKLKVKIQSVESLDLTDEGYLSELRLTCVNAAKCFL